MPKTKSKKLTWEEKISKQLVGRKIVEVRWMTKEEADESYWDYQPVLLILDDGTALCPMSDSEGNNAGALCHLGISGYKEFIHQRRAIKKKREKEVYEQIRRRKSFFYNTIMGGAITIVGTLLVSMIYFLIDMIKEASG